MHGLESEEHSGNGWVGGTRKGHICRTCRNEGQLEIVTACGRGGNEKSRVTPGALMWGRALKVRAEKGQQRWHSGKY